MACETVKLENMEGFVRSAVEAAVAQFQVSHQGQMPRYVWVPRGHRPDEQQEAGLRSRGVTVCEHKGRELSVWVTE
jgi:hypothetical protein